MAKCTHKSELHRFFCGRCGNEGIPILRNSGHLHSKEHKKKLYCIHCKEEVNHIECRNYAELEEFKTKFKEGIYNE